MDLAKLRVVQSNDTTARIVSGYEEGNAPAGLDVALPALAQKILAGHLLLPRNCFDGDSVDVDGVAVKFGDIMVSSRHGEIVPCRTGIGREVLPAMISLRERLLDGTALLPRECYAPGFIGWDNV